VADLTKGKNKASVLTQSKENWERFKETEGKEYVHEMEQAKKDGYLDKIEFLERADLKQFEQERNLRIKQRKALQRSGGD